MKVHNLVIERKGAYDADYPSMLVGLVQIQGEHGKMEVKLSSAIVSQIFTLIQKDVKRVADYNASQSGDAISEAASEVLLISSGEEKDVPPF